MRVARYTVCSILATLSLSLSMTAQAAAQAGTAKATVKQRAPFRSECVAPVGFCVSVPSSWKRVGDIYDDLGFVAAEPHTGADAANGPQLTVVAFEPPDEAASTANPPAEKLQDSAPPSLDELVERMLTPSGALASAQTLQRRRTLLNGAPSEIVRVQFHDAAGKAGAIEEVALIEGDDGLVYSVALRCEPQDFDRLEPLFQQAAQSWHRKSAKGSAASGKTAAKPQPSSAPAPPAQPKQDSARP